MLSRSLFPFWCNGTPSDWCKWEFFFLGSLSFNVNLCNFFTLTICAYFSVEVEVSICVVVFHLTLSCFTRVCSCWEILLWRNMKIFLDIKSPNKVRFLLLSTFLYPFLFELLGYSEVEPVKWILLHCIGWYLLICNSLTWVQMCKLLVVC